MSKCKSCGADIKWITLKNSGKYHPVDPYLHTLRQGSEGKTVIVTEEGRIIRGTLMPFEEGANASGYISHFATCPDADRHRKDRAKMEGEE